MSIRRAIAASVIGRPLAVAIGLAASIVIARLLTPGEVGVFGVAYGAIAILAGLAHFGAIDYLVQHRSPDRTEFGRVLTVTIGIAVLLAALVWLTRGRFAGAYGEPRLAALLGLLSLNLVLGTLGVGAVALLQREYAFVTLQMVNLGAMALGAGTAIGLAWSGHGAASLAWGQIATSAATVTALTALRPAAVLCRPVLCGAGAILRFGALRSLTMLASNSSDHAVPLILGRALGFTAVGLYDRAFGIASRLTGDVAGAAMRVLFVALADAKGDRDRVSALVLTATGNLTAVMWPAFTVLAILAEPLIVLLYGEPWRDAAPALVWLAIGGMGFVFGLPPYELMTAEGDVGTQLGLECLGAALKLGLVASLAGFGLVPALAGAALALWLLSAITWGCTVRRFRLDIRGFAARCVGSLALSLAASLGPGGLVALASAERLSGWAILVLGGIAAAAGWLLAAFLLRHPIYGETLLWTRALARTMSSGKAGA